MAKYFVLALGSFVIPMALAQSPTVPNAASEADFLEDMPIILSVSRLAQRLDETPGAVTLLDRNFIRLSGARDIVDLLRMVPGFQSTNSFETDAPMATYHGRVDDWANRIQVLIDGRSVYSSHLQGSAGIGWQSLALDDIERVEILRGSNSAAYGARAFLGVVNLVSRDVRSTHGTATSFNAGENGIADAGVRWGWGSAESNYRLSVDSRGDQGLRGAFGANRTNRVNFASHFSLPGDQELEFRTGALAMMAGRGYPGDAGNNQRSYQTDSAYMQFDWRRQISPEQDLVVSASHTQIDHRDVFPYLDASMDKDDLGVSIIYYGIPIDFGGKEYNNALSLQSTLRYSDTLRLVGGTEFRHEKVVSKSSFDILERVDSSFVRLFGNVEWRQNPSLIWNLGGLAETSSLGGDSLSPRLMLNWHVNDQHTLRAGASTAFRPPSAFEKFAAVRYYDQNGKNPITTTENHGLARSEKVLSEELGYYFNIPKQQLSGDVRVFRESVIDGISPTGTVTGREYFNGDNYRITGVEYQLAWKPWESTRLGLNQTLTQIDIESLVDESTAFRVKHGAPRLTSAFHVFQTLSPGVTLSLLHQEVQDVALMSDANRFQLFSMKRTDVRLAKAFRWAANNAELALTVQNIDQPYRDSDRKFWFDRRAMLTLRIEN
jgi:iron complex outermembrane receptor protein